ncbi:Sucrose-binding protein, partial [Mucuna pruriens]
MAMKTKLSLAIFFFLLALFSNLALGAEETQVEDYELEACKQLCLHNPKYSESDKQMCVQSCDKYYGTKQEEETRGKKESPTRKEEGQEEENPFVFEHEDFDTEVETEGGRIRVLHKFTKKSKLLRGIENFRLSILEAKAHTFVSPRHYDSDVVLFVLKGQAVLGLVKESETEKLMVEAGDMMTITAGTPLYMANRDENENEKLLIAMFHIPLFSLGKYVEIFGLGGRDPESVLSAFSWNVLQAALQSPRGKLERLFNKQNGGSIFKISRDHLQALVPKKSSWWPFGGISKAPFNLFTKRPSFSNECGRQTQVAPSDEKSGLDRLNLMLSYTNITQKCMSTIHYNSRVTKIAMVMDGRGYLQIACPHVSERSEEKHEKSSPSYSRISAELKPGMMFVVPPGHPFLAIAARKENLQIISFEVNARDNNKYTYAVCACVITGKDNIVTSLDNIAKELAFNYPAEIVNGIFDGKEGFFLPFELPREDHGRAYA